MKNERVYIRTTEKTKLKLLEKSQEYNMNLSDFVLNVTERECDLDVIQIWIHSFIDYVIKNNEDSVITHYKTKEGHDAWSVSAFEDTYFNRLDLLNALDERSGYNLPRMLYVLDHWNEFVKRLKLLGLWEEM